MDSPTPKQVFWRHRNYLKFRISSWGLPVNDKCLTLFEQDKVRQINELTQALKDNWDKNNRIIKRTKADER